MTNIIIDAYKSKNPFSGLGQFSINFVRELHARNSIPLSPLVIGKKEDLGISEDESLAMLAPHLLRKAFSLPYPKHQLWHSLNQLPSFLPPQGSKWLYTIHDLNFLHEKSEEKARKYLHKIQKHLNQAHRVSTISEYSKSLIERHLDLGNKSVSVIYNGIKPGAIHKQKANRQLSQKLFFFSLGIFNRKKNFEALVNMMPLLPEFHLVIAGDNQSAYGDTIRKRIKELGLQERVHLPGKISEDEKQWYFHHCKAFLFPSTAEGFGMPVIEAMYTGCPVVLSTHCSLPEIGGKMAGYFPSFEPQTMLTSLENHLLRVSQNPNEFKLASQEHAQQFNWTNCIDQYLKLYEEMLID